MKPAPDQGCMSLDYPLSMEGALPGPPCGDPLKTWGPKDWGGGNNRPGGPTIGSSRYVPPAKPNGRNVKGPRGRGPRLGGWTETKKRKISGQVFEKRRYETLVVKISFADQTSGNRGT